MDIKLFLQRYDLIFSDAKPKKRLVSVQIKLFSQTIAKIILQSFATNKKDITFAVKTKLRGFFIVRLRLLKGGQRLSFLTFLF